MYIAKAKKYNIIRIYIAVQFFLIKTLCPRSKPEPEAEELEKRNVTIKFGALSTSYYLYVKVVYIGPNNCIMDLPTKFLNPAAARSLIR